MSQDILRVRALLERSTLRPAKRQELHLVTELHAIGKPVDGARAPLSVVFVLDASGSMAGLPILHVQRSVHMLADLLAPEDKVGVVAFSNAAVDVAPLAPLGEESKRVLKRRVDGISAGGGTNIEAGVLRGRALLGARAPHERQVLVLLSDGQPNSGAADLDSLSRIVEGMRPDVALTTLGYGGGHDVDLLSGMASAGGGTYWYVPDPEEAGVEFARAIGAQGDVVADGIEVAFEPKDGVEVAEVYDRKPRFTRGGLVVSAPDLRENAKHVIVARLIVDAPFEKGPTELVRVRVVHRAVGGDTTAVEAAASATVVDQEPALHVEAHALAELAIAERVRKDARAAADQGNFDVACAILRKAIARLEAVPGYKAMDGSALSEAVEQLVDEVTAYGRRPSREQYQEFKATNLGLDLAQGSIHAADVKMSSERSQRIMLGAQGGQLAGVVVVTHQGRETRYPLEADMTIGRVQGNGIAVASSSISKRHTRLLVRDGNVIVVDLKSTNGTFVNGKNVHSPVVLKVGDKVSLGDVLVRVELAPSAAVDTDKNEKNDTNDPKDGS